jgi:hypothetical protein
MGSYVSFSNVSRCSRLKAPRLDDVDLSPTSPHHQRHTRRKPRSTWNNRKRGISPNLSMPALATIMTHTTSSTRSKGTRMVPAVVTTVDVAAATTAGRTRAHHLNPQDHGSLAKTSVTRHSQHGYDNLPMSPSTLGRQTLSSSLMTTASPAS